MPSAMLGKYYLPSQLNTVDTYKSYLQKQTVPVSYLILPNLLLEGKHGIRENIL